MILSAGAGTGQTAGHLTDYDRCSRNRTEGSDRCLRKGLRTDGQLRCLLQTWSDCILMPSVSFDYQWQLDQQICNLHFNWNFYLYFNYLHFISLICKLSLVLSYKAIIEKK